MNKITTPQMEIALATYFNYRRNLIVPNVCWGMDLHECDLFILSQAAYATEVEIKVSMADLRADDKKRHGHRSNRIKRLYFALPIELGDKHHAEIMELVPERAGVLFVRNQDKQWWPRPRVIKSREAVNQKTSRFTETERFKVARLGAMRIWLLKMKLGEQVRGNKYLTACVKSSNNYLRDNDPEKALAVLLRELAKVK